ncbi:hypothetical protein [Effusibacillus consociatus]|uniref:Uncharacterized protein n=1 Tax=Effusibacillus consociatus TaxID=1117041 RepID=A0ABV9Q2T4_9BACL
MGKSINDIINCKISKVQRVFTNGTFDFWDILTDKCSIGIYNPVTYGKTVDKQEQLDDHNKDRLLNHVIKNVVIKNGQCLIFELDSSEIIHISLREADFKTPEAAEIHFQTGEIMIID